MRSCEGTGKNIEQAVQNALLELKASREDVDIKILNEGGFLKKAKVLVTISEDAVEKYEKREQFKKELLKEENDEDFAEKFIKKKVEQTAKEEPAAKEEKTVEEKVETKPAKKVKIVADEEISSNEKQEEKEERNFIENERKFTGEEFIEGLLKTLDLEGNIEKIEEDRFTRFNVTGENLNDLIGYRGECMLSLSYIMNIVCKSENRKKIVLDIENYREKRAESLRELAKRTADKVAKSGRYFKFEPMDASERKVIHTALQEDERVTTLSKGEEPHRYLIVFPREYKEKR